MTTRAVIDVNLRIDHGRWGGYQRWLVLLTALTIVFDGADIQLLRIALPSIMQEWGLARGAFAPVVSVGYLGMAIGGAAAGVAGDRLGRRNALLGSMLLFGAATLALTTADTVGDIAFYRLLTGIGLGGALPNAAALAAEFVPVRQRSVAVTLMR